MNKETVIAAAQFCARDEDIDYNLQAHYQLVKLAAGHGVQLLVFPEMSITGYVRDAAARLAFSRGDFRLDELRKLAAAHSMTIVAGAPVRLGAALHVGAFIMKPDTSVSLYTKHYLYKNENDFFIPNCGNNPSVPINDEQVSLAICFDMENTQHIAKAAETGSTIYSVSIFYSESAIDDAHVLLSGYARTYGLNVLMSNYCGHLYHTPAGGKSAFWNNNGELLACMDVGKTGLVLGVKKDGVWYGKIVTNQ